MTVESQESREKQWTGWGETTMVLIAIDLILVSIILFKYFDYLAQAEKIITFVFGGLPPVLYFFRVSINKKKTLPEFLSLRVVRIIVIIYTAFIVFFFILLLLPIHDVTMVTKVEKEWRSGVEVMWANRPPGTTNTLGEYRVHGIAAGSYDVKYYMQHFPETTYTYNVGLWPISLRRGHSFKISDKILGRLYVQSSPQGARIFIDTTDKRVLTNNYVYDVTVGKHWLTLKKKGYYVYSKEIYVNEVGVTTPDPIKLQRLVGHVHVTSVPSRANVYLNGKYRDHTPVTVAHEIGDYELELRKVKGTDSGYRWRKNISITANKIRDVLVEFDSGNIEELYPLYIMSKPRASIHVDGRPTGEGTNSGPVYLFEGQHYIKLKNGANEYDFYVTIPAIPPVTDTFDLNRQY